MYQQLVGLGEGVCRFFELSRHCHAVSEGCKRIQELGYLKNFQIFACRL
jgi:hypothetical protein